MKKIIVSFLLVFVLALTACGNKNEIVDTVTSDSVESVVESITMEQSDSSEPTDTTSKAENVSVAESETTSSEESSTLESSVTESSAAESATEETVSSVEETTDNWGDIISWNDEDESSEPSSPETESVPTYETFDFSSIPEYSGQDVIKINDDKPFFTDEQKVYNGTSIYLSDLDYLGRCQVAMGVVGQETEPTEERGDISAVHPTGWNQKKYGDTWLYNRSHLLMFALTGLNDDPRNLITGTEYFNQKLMLGYEAMVLWAVDTMNAHVVYRVTPVFDGENLVAKGVLMEAYCIEYPEDCEFCVFVYNVEPGVVIDYATGDSREAE